MWFFLAIMEDIEVSNTMYNNSLIILLPKGTSLYSLNLFPAYHTLLLYEWCLNISDTLNVFGKPGLGLEERYVDGVLMVLKYRLNWMAQDVQSY